VQGGVTTSNAVKNLLKSEGNTENPSRSKSESGYQPKEPLPRDENGNPIPDSENPHTQVGTKTSKRRGEQYKQAREFGENGDHVKDIDFTDHGRPKEHTNPHQHKIDPNTGKRGKAEPLDN
jgi:hypothetical protein